MRRASARPLAAYVSQKSTSWAAGGIVFLDSKRLNGVALKRNRLAETLPFSQ